MSQIFNFILSDGTAVTQSFSLVPVNFPTSTSSYIATGDPLFYSGSPQTLDLIPNVFKVECNTAIAANTWYITGSNLTASANIISGSYSTGSMGSVMFQFADHSRAPENIIGITVQPHNKSVGFNTSFVLGDTLTFLGLTGSVTLALVPQDYDVVFKGAKKFTPFTVRVPQGNSTASANIVSSQNVAAVITPKNVASFTYTAQVIDQKLAAIVAGTSASYVTSSATFDNQVYNLTASWADDTLTAETANTALTASFITASNVKGSVSSASAATTAKTASYFKTIGGGISTVGDSLTVGNTGFIELVSGGSLVCDNSSNGIEFGSEYTINLGGSNNLVIQGQGDKLTLSGSVITGSQFTGTASFARSASASSTATSASYVMGSIGSVIVNGSLYSTDALFGLSSGLAGKARMYVANGNEFRLLNTSNGWANIQLGQVTANGNVGIGTSTPSASLDIHQAGPNWTVNGWNKDLSLPLVGAVEFGSDSTGGNRYGMGNSGGILYLFQTKASGSTDDNANYVLMVSGSNLGLGTSIPNNKLQVVGGITATSLTGSMAAGNIVGVVSSASYATSATSASNASVASTLLVANTSNGVPVILNNALTTGSTYYNNYTYYPMHFDISASRISDTFIARNVCNNLSFVLFPNSQSFYKIATLPASSGNTFDYLTMRVRGGTWATAEKCELFIYLSNRAGPTSDLEVRNWGYNGTYNSNEGFGIQCYKSGSNGPVDVYLVTLTSNFIYSTVGIDMMEHGLAGVPYQTVFYPYPTGSTATPAGTLCFDTTNTTTYPPNLAYNVGSMNLNGNLTWGGNANRFVSMNGGGSGDYISGYGPMYFQVYDGAGYNPKLTILSNGNVGVGSKSPNESLTVSGSTPTFAMRTNGDPNNYYFKIVNNWDSTKAVQMFGAGSNEILRQTWTSGNALCLNPGGGKMGINTTAPATVDVNSKLDVNGNLIILSGSRLAVASADNTAWASLFMNSSYIPEINYPLQVDGYITCSQVTASYFKGTGSYLKGNASITNAFVGGTVEFTSGAEILFDNSGNGISFAGNSAADFNLDLDGGDNLALTTRQGNIYFSASMVSASAVKTNQGIFTTASVTRLDHVNEIWANGDEIDFFTVAGGNIVDFWISGDTSGCKSPFYLDNAFWWTYPNNTGKINLMAVDGTSDPAFAVSTLQITTDGAFKDLNVPGEISASAITASHGLVIPVTGSAPSGTAQTGSMVFNKANNFLYIYNGTSWKSASFA